MRIGVEHRGRLEGFTGAGFADDREDLYWLNRFRVTARFSMKPWLSAAVQAQDARVEGRNGTITGAPFRDQFDLRLAHVDVGNVREEPVRACAAGGRSSCSATSGSSGTATGSTPRARSTPCAASSATRNCASTASPPRSSRLQMDDVNRSGGGNYFYGADAPLAVLPNGGILEPYEFVRTRAESHGRKPARTGDLTSSTSGVRSAGKLSARTDYNVEAAIQRGSLGIRRHFRMGRTRAGRPHDSRRVEDLSGVRRIQLRLWRRHTRQTAMRGTFDQLYPTAHDKYGLADQVGWKNIHHLRTGVEVRPHAKLALAGGYHSFWLASATDALYNAGGAVLARIPTGAPDRHVGQELDIQATYTPSPRIQLHGGYAHIFTGAFLKAATPGKSYSAPYVMVTTMLLGMEK